MSCLQTFSISYGDGPSVKIMSFIKIMISGEQREQQQQLEKRGCKVSHIPVFHEFYRPTHARTAKIISVMGQIML